MYCTCTARLSKTMIIKKLRVINIRGNVNPEQNLHFSSAEGHNVFRPQCEIG